MGWINWTLWLHLSCFPILAYPQQIMVTFHRNQTINTINRQWPWRLRFHYCSPPVWATNKLHFILHLCIYWTCTIHYFFGRYGDFGSWLLWNGVNFLVSSDQEVSVVVRDNGKYLVTHGELHTESINILSSLKYDVEYLFGACWIFVTANLLLLSLPPLLMVTIVKLSGGDIVSLRYNTL